ncbi:PREDICTED: protein ripply2 [Nanorana parkeri]|uniref:protein ripply2 n=1 Tax=Nanorana parkeri TaxID=125878 RepID=UPI00085487E4|nr:PREDICTED: protein ripply2 [Nanorana parkeri]
MLQCHLKRCSVLHNPQESCCKDSENYEVMIRCGRMWRPWFHNPVTSMPAQQTSNSILQSHSANQGAIADKAKLPDFQHPVKLFWPKSKCYDFLYQEAEELLRNFPVQATISLYQESDSSASEDEEFMDN